MICANFHAKSKNCFTKEQNKNIIRALDKSSAGVQHVCIGS